MLDQAFLQSTATFSSLLPFLIYSTKMVCLLHPVLSLKRNPELEPQQLALTLLEVNIRELLILVMIFGIGFLSRSPAAIDICKGCWV